jgi:hypothetical protein
LKDSLLRPLRLPLFVVALPIIDLNCVLFCLKAQPYPGILWQFGELALAR